MGSGYRAASGFAALSLLCGASLLAPTVPSAAAMKTEPQLITVDDYFRLGDVGDPRISPDGLWIAYTVTTPTLILGGKEDWNVPIVNSEQLFLAPKLLGVPTERVVYPDEFHGIDTPAHAKDLYERYLVWFGRYLKGEQTAKVH